MGDLSWISAVRSRPPPRRNTHAYFEPKHRKRQLPKLNLRPHLVLEALSPSYHSSFRIIHQHFRRPAAGVVVRSEHRAVRAHVEYGEKIPLADQWKFSSARKKVARLTDGTDHIGNLGFPRLAAHRNNLVIRTVQRRTHQIVHRRIDNQKALVIIRLPVEDARQQYARRSYDGTTRFEQQMQLQLAQRTKYCSR